MKRLKVGVIGCGVMGGFHIKQYRNIDEVEIIGASDIDKSRAPEGIPFFSDYNDILRIADAVTITTPTSTHFKIAIDALKAGLHVLIEKPITQTPEEAKHIIELAKSKKLTLAVGHIERFNPAYMICKKELCRRSPELIDIKRLSPLPERITDASCVIDMMIHDIDLVLNIASSKVKHVNAIGKKIKTNKLDQATAVLSFENGMIANIEASRVNKDKVRKMIAATARDIYEVDMLNKKVIKRRNGQQKGIEVSALDQLHYELKNFIGAISRNRKPEVTGEDGLAALEIANKIEELALKS